jgi:hypothetical protein
MTEVMDNSVRETEQQQIADLFERPVPLPARLPASARARRAR